MNPLIVENKDGKPVLAVTFELCVGLEKHELPVSYDAVIYSFNEEMGMGKSKLEDACMIRYNVLTDAEKEEWRADAEQEVSRLIRQNILRTVGTW